MRRRVAPLPASSRSDRVGFPGCPFHAPFLLSRHRNLGLPLGFSSSAVPAMNARVTPNLSYLRRCRFQPGFGSPRCLLASPHRPRCRTWVSPCPASPALPVMDHRVASILASFGGAELPVPESPRASAFRYRRRFAVQVAPHFESSGTV